MENLIQMWLNPINLGILFLCLRLGSGSWRTVIRPEKTNKFKECQL